MRAFLVVAVALSLSGCADTNFYGERDSDMSVAEAAPPPAAAPAPPADIAAMPTAPRADTTVHTETLPSPSAEPTQEVSAAAPPPPPQEAMPAPAEDVSTPPPPAMQEAPAPVAVVETTKLPPSAHCMTLANQRAQDAAYQGEDPDTQEAVHTRTYTECVAWDLKHAFK